MQNLQTDTVFSNLYIQYHQIDQEGIEEVQRGTGHWALSVTAQGLSRLKKQTTLYGKALYNMGQTHQVAWREVGDYDRLRPYGLADDFSGELIKRSYSFIGGWAKEHCNYSFGLSGKYLAQASFRKTDPRPLNISSRAEIEASAGVFSYNLNTLFCLDLGIEIYSQSNNLLFVGRKTGLFEYNMLGLGEYSQRFSGNKTDAVFKGIGGFIGIETMTDKILRTSTFLKCTDTPWVLMNINSLPLAHLRAYELTHHSIYTITPTILLYISSSVQTKQGYEGIFGAGIDVAYPKLGEELRYNGIDYRGEVALQRQWTRGKYTFAYLPKIVCQGRKESYTTKQKEIKLNNIYASLSLRLEKQIHTLSTGVETTIGSRLNTHNSMKGMETTDKPILNMLLQNIKQQSSPYSYVDLKVLAKKRSSRLTYYGTLQSHTYKVWGGSTHFSYSFTLGLEL